VRAPGRVNLIGDHTDYNDGFCLPLAIDRACTATWQPHDDRKVVARSQEFEGVVELPVDGSVEPGSVEPPWARFVAGVVRDTAERGVLEGFDVSVDSSVPAGAGLSSSSALAVALTLVADQRLHGGAERGRVELAQAALRAEVLATGVPGGLMDQLTSLFGVSGHALLIDCRTQAITPVALPTTHSVLVVHCGKARTLVGSAYAERRAACEAEAARLGLAALRDATPDQVAGNSIARHVVSENARVVACAEALERGDLNAVGPLLLASHASLRDDYRVSTPELDLLVELLVRHGAVGARLTGAGFGGCVIGLVQRNHLDDCAAKVTLDYESATGLRPEAFVVQASGGASTAD
jgi:galactokinase